MSASRGRGGAGEGHGAGDAPSMLLLAAGSRPLPFERAPAGPLLAAVGLAAAAVGFAAYLYAGPYHRALAELKREKGELRTAETLAEVRARELGTLRDRLDGRRGESVRPQLRRLGDAIAERLAALAVEGRGEPRRLRGRPPAEAVVEARGPWLGKA